jgi:DNA-binding transcriptional MerR regulator
MTDRKLYYSMGEVADMLDVAPSLLRFWEKRFDCITPHKNKKGNRLFSPGDVRNLKTIYHLVKERGMTLAGAEKQLKARRGEIERDMEIAERLGSIRSLLLEVRNELGGDGTIVDDTVTEDVEIVETPIATATAVAPPIPEPEPEIEPEVEIEPEPEPETPPLRYFEQTLF